MLNKILTTYRLFLIIICIGISGCANLRDKRNAIHTLIGLGRNGRLKAQAIKQETINFKRLKEYIISDKMQKGLSKDTAAKKFGEPVVIISEQEGEKWAYKSGEASWFNGGKIYLFFNEDGNLVKWECVNLRGTTREELNRSHIGR